MQSNKSEFIETFFSATSKKQELTLPKTWSFDKKSPEVF